LTQGGPRNIVACVLTPPTLEERSSGVLLHVTSLPGPGEHGRLGRAADDFIAWLAEAGQAWWQMLPVGPPGYGGSPYSAESAFAGSPALLDPEAAPPSSEDIAAFARRSRDWLDDYALFRALKGAHGGVEWTRWEAPYRQRDPAALERARREHASAIELTVREQAAFELQWCSLRARARARGIGLIGDVPIFVAHDSADVWAHRELFRLDADGLPTVVAGVPPDYFSATGQRWGNPLYRWRRLAQRGYDWWIARFRATLARFDAVRLDHFIGFVRNWEIRADEPTAVRGRWLKGPGIALFQAVERALGTGDLPFIAEDLGLVTPKVLRLRDELRLPGIKILQFAFGTDPNAASFLPHNYPRRAVVYTGTHDNDTTVGWFRGESGSVRDDAQVEKERALAMRYLPSDGERIHWDMLRAAWASVASVAIAPMQDLLGLGSPARMNQPGSLGPRNWTWRVGAGDTTRELGARLRELTATYGRLR
jgi:4-alpha-glucanotransferase